MNQRWKVIFCFVPMLVGLACQIILSGVCFTVYVLIKQISTGQLMGTVENITEKNTGIVLSADALMIINAVVIAVTMMIAFFWYRKYRPETDKTLKQVFNWRLLLVMLMLGISMQTGISMVLTQILAILPETVQTEYTELMETLVGGNVILSLLVTVILAPLAEELLFRGVTMKIAEKYVPFFAANLIQAALFGIYHMNFVQGAYAFVFGVVLGFVAHYFHSVWAAILLHACFNGAGQLLELLPDNDTAYIVIAVAAVVLLAAAIKLFPKAKNEKFTENSFDE